MPRANTHTFDGLVVGYGTHTADNNVQAVLPGSNGVVTVSVEITLADVSATSVVGDINPQDVIIPRGSIIKSALLHTLIAPTSASTNATLDLGLMGIDGTEDDFNGLVSDATIAEMGLLGEGIILDGVSIADAVTAASTVASVGAVADMDCVIASAWNSEAFSAGVVRLLLEYIPPSGSSGRTLLAIN